MLRLLLPALMLLNAVAVGAETKIDPATLAIEHQQFVLDNGLTVLVHEDHAVPIVSVNVWYKVGSRDERFGRTGFAHLFEHFFFNGSENYPHGFREAMDDLGANNRNGTTNTDRTNFYEDVPVSALERTLYLEADRMGFLAGHISEAMLERERGVVKNEKRQGENQPYGGVFSRMVEAMYPAGHPYSWSTIGRMEDLDAAQLEDVRDWYRTYYGPSNAVLVLAGDIDLAQAKALVGRYFGPIAPGKPLARLRSAVPRLDHAVQDRIQDRVPQTRVYAAWHLPPLGSRELHAMELLASILSGSESARLDRALRFAQPLATDVGAFVWGKQLASMLIIQASLQQDSQVEALEAALDSTLQRLLEDGPSAAEMELARARLLADFARGIETLGGFGGRSAVLAEGAALLGDASAYQRRLHDLATIDAETVRSVAQHWLRQPGYRLRVEPFPAYSASAEQIDRSQLPALGAPPEVGFPALQRFTLDNGLNVWLLQRSGAPLVQLSLAIDAGSAADPAQAPGTATLTLDAMLKGTRSSDAFKLADRRDALGSTLDVRTTLDLSLVQMQALRAQLQPSLDLLAEVVSEPAFPPAMLEIQRKQQLAAIAQQKASPVGAALRLAPPLLYGPQHPYGQPWGGLGREDVVSTLQQAQLRDWHQRWFVPANATLIVAGALSADELKAALAGNLARWKGGAKPLKPALQIAQASAPRRFLLDKPGAPQSVLVAAQISGAAALNNELALETVMRNFGGMATSRLNRNLRLDKHWSYGSSGFVSAARGPRPFLVIAPVQTDKTAEALAEVRAEILGLAGARPIAGEEFASIQRSQLSRLPARFETLASLVDAGLDLLALNRPSTFYQHYAQNLRSLQPAQLNQAAADAVDPEQLIWIVIGDLEKVRPTLQGLGWGDWSLLQADAL